MRAERPGGGALGVDVDPLVVAGGVGERVDPLLVDRDPVAVAEVLADGGLQLGESVKVAHRAAQPRGPPATYSTWPETNDAPSLTKNDTACAMSSGVPDARDRGLGGAGGLELLEADAEPLGGAPRSSR